MYNPIFFLLSFWYILPAYVANGFAVFSKFFKNRHPIDGGRFFRDGRPVLGNGKSWEGFIIGVVSGVCIGCVQYLTAPILLDVIEQYLIMPLELYPIVLFSLLQVFFVALGALIGDLIGSFIKRRLNISRGRSAPVLDQLDFLVGAILLGWIVNQLPLIFIGFLLLVTPIIHLLANIVGYLLKLKREPW
ncbi:MAG: CDP-2,3-bis-(O-geranylgeranyl)-sn-glycerol synthase [Promethearchaeota archaeon]